MLSLKVIFLAFILLQFVIHELFVDAPCFLVLSVVSLDRVLCLQGKIKENKEVSNSLSCY